MCIRDRGQFDLFAGIGGGEDDAASNAFALDIPEDNWDRKHELALEREMLGLYVSGHPLDGFEEALAAQTDTPLTKMLNDEVHNGQELIIGGLGVLWAPVSYTHLRAHETVARISYAVFCL